jgi:hypothetical protein
MYAGMPMLSPLVFSVATTAVPAVLADVKPVPANLVVWALGNAAEVIADVALVCWNRDELLVATNSVVLAVGNALLVIADVALVCWNSEDCDVLMALAVMADVLEVN